MKALVLVLLAVSANAAVAPSFEQTLGEFRAGFLAQRAKQIKAKALAASSDIEQLSYETDRLRSDAQRLRNAVNDLKWRAQRARNDPRRPDAWLRNDLQRLVWELRDHARDVQNAEWRAQSVLSGAQKDPSAVSSAQRLQSGASWLRSEDGWLQMDGQNAAWDFRNAGFSMEAFDVENNVRDAQNASNDLERTANAIYSKIKG
jgi:hypothetical protein